MRKVIMGLLIALAIWLVSPSGTSRIGPFRSYQECWDYKQAYQLWSWTCQYMWD